VKIEFEKKDAETERVLRLRKRFRKSEQFARMGALIINRIRYGFVTVKQLEYVLRDLDVDHSRCYALLEMLEKHDILKKHQQYKSKAVSYRIVCRGKEPGEDVVILDFKDDILSTLRKLGRVKVEE